MSTKIIRFGENTSGSSKQKTSTVGYKKNLQEIIGHVRSAKNKLGNMTLHMESENSDTSTLNEALEALDDAIDLMEDVLDNAES